MAPGTPPPAHPPPTTVKYDFVAWLVERGVAWGDANRFAMATGCSSCEEAAIYLRLQLPPLQLANSDAIDDEMRELLGCGGAVARRVIQDLDVFSALLLAMCSAKRVHLV